MNWIFIVLFIALGILIGYIFLISSFIILTKFFFNGKYTKVLQDITDLQILTKAMRKELDDEQEWKINHVAKTNKNIDLINKHIKDERIHINLNKSLDGDFDSEKALKDLKENIIDNSDSSFNKNERFIKFFVNDILYRFHTQHPHLTYVTYETIYTYIQEEGIALKIFLMKQSKADSFKFEELKQKIIDDCLIVHNKLHNQEENNDEKSV